jgi:hypothetical protein
MPRRHQQTAVHRRASVSAWSTPSRTCCRSAPADTCVEVMAKLTPPVDDVWNLGGDDGSNLGRGDGWPDREHLRLGGLRQPAGLRQRGPVNTLGSQGRPSDTVAAPRNGGEMRIPIFLSAPTSLSPEQESVRNRIVRLLKSQGLEPRTLGRQEYPTDYPLREVAVIAKHCSGGIILGFEQLLVRSGISKRGTNAERTVRNIRLATPWNNLEAGILFGLGLPLLIFRDDGLGGVASSTTALPTSSCKTCRPQLRREQTATSYESSS